MYFVLELNADPMGGGASFNYVAHFRQIENAEKYIEEKKGPWRSFIITKLVQINDGVVQLDRTTVCDSVGEGSIPSVATSLKPINRGQNRDS